MKEHHFIVKYSREGGWCLDVDTEQILFEDGKCVYNLETNEWEAGYLGDGEYNNQDDEICGTLGKVLKQLNKEE